MDIVRPIPVAAQQIASDERINYSTGIVKLDNLIGGGLYGGEVLEIYGQTRTGKTQMCLSIAAHFCHFRSDKLSVVYFDLKQDFKATRFEEICEGAEKDLQNILIVRPTNFDDLVSTMNQIRSEVSNKESQFVTNLKLLIFDSAPAIIYPEIDNQNSWRLCGDKFFNALTELQKLNGGLIAIIVNHEVKTWSMGQDVAGTSSSMSTSGPKPTLGQYWSHKSNFKVRLSENATIVSNGTFNATLEKSTRTVTDGLKSFNFSIKKTGVVCI